MSKTRPTIGFIVSGILDPLTEQLVRGVMNASRDDDINLVVIPVKYIDRDMTGLPDVFEYQYKEAASFINTENIEGLVIAADCVGCLTSKSNLLRFLKKFENIPMVLVASRLEGYISVSFDNRTGIVDGLNTLINDFGCKKICMFSGSDDNSDALERKNIYLEIMEKHGLPVTDEMIVEGNLSYNCIPEASRLLDQNPDADAIFCVNDDTAMGLYNAMRHRGLEPGRDIKVMGFDNALASARINPSLSSVDADPIELGAEGYRYLRRLMNGEKVESGRYPTRFIQRESFGVSIDKLDRNESHLLDEDYLDKYFDEVFYRYKSVEEYVDSDLRNDYKRLMKKLFDYIYSGHEDHALHMEIMQEIDIFFRSGATKYTDTDQIVPYIESVYDAAVKYYQKSNERQKINDSVIDIFKYLLQAMDYKYSDMELELNEILYSMKTFVKDTTKFRYGNDQSYVSLVSNLDWMNIKNAYIYAFNKPIDHLEGEEMVLPKHMYLKAALKNGKSYAIPYGRQRIRINDLFSNKELTHDKFNFVLFPIYFDETIYGCVICDLTDIIFKNGEFINNQFGAAIRMIDLLKTNSAIQQQLEENLAAMKAHNIELDKLSRNDALTGILNRRGFLDIAGGLIADNREMGRDSIFAYIDMNNLKIINDRFGHEEGDFALKTISTLLTEIIGTYGVVGRIGGDEYAAVYYGNESEEKLENAIISRFTEFNETSDKVYNVTVSSGFFRVPADVEMNMTEIMAAADQKLYIAKQSKDNRVLKQVV